MLICPATTVIVVLDEDQTPYTESVNLIPTLYCPGGQSRGTRTLVKVTVIPPVTGAILKIAETVEF